MASATLPAAFSGQVCYTIAATTTAFTNLSPPLFQAEEMNFVPQRMACSRSALPLRSPYRSGRTGGAFSSGYAWTTRWEEQGLSRHHEGDGVGGHRLSPQMAFYCIRRDYFATSSERLLPASQSCSRRSIASVVDSCFAEGFTSDQTANHDARGRRRRRRGSTRLWGLRKPRDVDGSPSNAGKDSGDRGHNTGEGSSPARSRARDMHGRSAIPASKRRPPEEDDMWSKSSVFEFKSLNDPDTNACGYAGLRGQPSGSRRASSPSSSSQRRPGPELRLTSDDQSGKTLFNSMDELLERGRPTSRSTIDDEFFKFREKEMLAGTPRRREVGPASRREVGSGGGGGTRRGGRSINSAVKVELATQLGVPATATYDELRTAYRVEIKRCHPDLAGDNEFRVKFLERKFQKLQGCWDRFNAEQLAATTTGGRPGAAETAEARGDPQRSSQAARARARAEERARDEARHQQAVAAAAAARRSRRPVMDRGRNIMDDGNSSSC